MVCNFSTCSSILAAPAVSPSLSTASTSPPSSAISVRIHTGSFPQSQSPSTPQANPISCIALLIHHWSTTRPETCVQCNGTTTTGVPSVTCRMQTSRVCTTQCVRGTNSSRPRTRSIGCSSLREPSWVCIFPLLSLGPNPFHFPSWLELL